MRPLALLIAFLVSVMAYADDGVVFVNISSWSEAIDLAKKTGKPIFLDAYTDWCGWCKVMDKQTFADKDVASVMNATFINVKMDMERGGGIDVAMKYHITGFPTFMVFAADGSPTYRTFGFQRPAEWLETLKLMTTQADAMTFKGRGPGIEMAWPDWHRSSFMPGTRGRKPSMTTVTDWFMEQEDKFGEVAFGVLARHAVSPDVEAWVLDHEASYAERYGEDANELRQSFTSRAFRKACADRDTVLLAYAKQIMASEDDSGRPVQHLLMDASYYEQTKQWLGVATVVRRLATTDAVRTHTQSMNELCWALYEHCDDSKGIDDGIVAMERLTSLPSVEWTHLDTYAALLYRGKRYLDAEREARRAIAMGTAAGADVSGTKDLLTKITDAVK